MTTEIPLPDKELNRICHEAIQNFKGYTPELQSAIGMLWMGQYYGWKVMLLIHDRKTIKKYEKILGIKIRETMPAVGERADKSVAWQLLKGVTNFWKAVKGELPGIRNPNVTE